MSCEILKSHREIWQKKKVLRDIYHDWYRLIIENMADNRPVLETGSGGGNFKEFFPDVISSDFIFCEWIDLNLDAHELPFKGNSLGNIIFIDVLHHLENPVLFFHEAQRVLQNNGRIIMLEPYISPFSYIIYNYFHQEDVDFKIDAWNRRIASNNKKKAFDGNSAIPTIMFSKEIKRFYKEFPNLKVIKKERLTFILYPLSGGFDRKSFVPAGMVKYISFIEKIFRPFGFIFALRTFVVLEKRV
jgi:SAM-dependent methyltransferase